MTQPKTLEQYEVLNRFTGEVQLSAEISVTPDMTPSVKLGLAVKWGIKNGANLIGVDLRDANLSDSEWIGANLRNADLIGAAWIGAEWIPKIKNIHTAVYEAASGEGALDMSTWHRDDNFCGTTHCRAGWINHLAGDGGRVLECLYGPSAAAELIYMASDPTMKKIPNWLANDADALADMKRVADAEKRT